MDYDQLTFFVGLAILAMQGFNVYLSNSIKLWAVQKFVAKTDFLETLQLWSRAEK